MKKRRFLCVLAALCVMLLSVGCGGSAEQTKTESSGVPASSAASEQSSKEVSESGELVPKITKNPNASLGMEADALEEGFYSAKAADALNGTDVRTAAPEAETTAPSPASPETVPSAEPGEDPGEVPPAEPAVSEVSGTEIIVTSDEPIPPESQIEPQVGLLTAGEWNDNNNWGFFTNLVNTKAITLPEQYGVVPNNRTAVTVKDGSGKVLANASVRLLDDKDAVLWNAVTDHEGNAYLFAPDGVKPAAVEVTLGDKTAKQPVQIKEVEQQTEISTQNNSVEVTLESEAKSYPKTDIMFVVDTTGSMSDELMFLQTEFTAIAGEIGSDNVRYSINFYRDDGDEYTTKRYPFSSDVAEIQKKLNSESAEGGGDLPEAVAEILDETINDGGWSKDSVKLMFLIFDAPPHDNKKDMLDKAIRKAAEQGIRIVPVVSSNSDRDTELFGRCIAIATGGTYVFLTDDSGVGYSHLEPIIGKYDVEKLYDIIIRVIGQYRQSE